MICQSCKKDFEEKEMQLSHNVPRYMGGTDSDGRKWLCKRCHGIYEWTIVKYVWNMIPEELQKEIKEGIKVYASK